MAPNRKKKKPATNPNRGFATTSILSKSKTVEIENPKEKVTEIVSSDSSNQGPCVPKAPDVLPKAIKELSELTPEELENQLEESELQLLVEKYGGKVTKDAKRQVTRLETERRLLRGHAEGLSISWWLPEDLVALIVDHLKIQISADSSHNHHKNKSLQPLLTENLNIQIWTLKRTLSGLGFADNRVREVLSFLLTSGKLQDTTLSSTSKETLWGLDECLDWLALTCTPDEMPDYETPIAKAKVQEANPSMHIEFVRETAPNTVESETLAEDKNDSDILTENSSDSDTTVEPQELLGKYLELQTRLFKRQPELTNMDLRRTRGSKMKKPLGQSMANDPDATSRRLLRRIARLQSDILFDREEGYEKWTELRLNLLREKTDRKKLYLDEDRRAQTTRGDETSSSPMLGSNDTTDDEDNSLQLGDFFSSLPESQVDSETGTSNMVTINPDSTTIGIRDFGKTQGLSPRRILTEACKARDSSSIVLFKATSTSGFSNRHSLIVRWSRDQEIPEGSPISAVTCEANSRAVKVEMIEVSTPDLIQSEAYVSTAALFIMFSSAKEGKVFLRLPPAWRDLWGELLLARNEITNASDREELKEIRVLTESIHDFARSSEPEVRASEYDYKIAPCISAAPSAPGSDMAVPNSKDLATMWSTKTSMPSYMGMLMSRKLLPIWSFKQDCLNAISDHQVVIICGETGCGKSTQVPAFILENELSNGRLCKIYVTEPRRISAISLARRVSEELGERRNDVGTLRSLVGYAIRLESHITSQTRLVYATTGIVMRMLERSDDLGDITHLVLDEVHERSIDSDFLLIVLRKLLIRRPALKVILMSATVNAEQFSRYLNGAPILNVPGRTFPVETKYLEDAIEVTNYSGDNGSQNSHTPDDNDELDDPGDDLSGANKIDAAIDLKNYSVKTRNTLSQYDEYRIDYELITRLLETIAQKNVYSEYSKAILVFLPGLAEIRRMNDILVSHPAFSHGWYVYSLHSTIATEEQEHAFLVPPKGIRKIVLATNIAETGITIPDVTCVIDTGRHKEIRFDERRQLSRLIESFISRANAKQRRGRAGRVQNGLCFHLFTKARHDTMMAEQQLPEMLRLSLQDLVLRVKICKLGSIEETLGEALDPPLPKNIRRAVDSLIDVKALTAGEALTALGRQLAKLPLDVFLGKLIILGCIFRCVDATLTIAAIISSKSPFSAPMGARAQADLARIAFKKGDSDLLTTYNAYCAWRRVCQSSGSTEYQFCRKNFLNQQTLSNIEDLKAQLTTTLIEAGLLVFGDAENLALNRARFYSRQRHFVEIPDVYDINNNDLVVNSVVAWSFYPKLMTRSGKGWRNVANNQVVSLHPTSINKSIITPSRFLSFYHIMQSSNKFTNAHETSPVSDFAIALVCGDAEFKMCSGVIVIDGNRLRFSVSDWIIMLLLKNLRMQLKDILSQTFKAPRKALSQEQEFWWGIWQTMFSKEAGAS